jgi:hypothetical protein
MPEDLSDDDLLLEAMIVSGYLLRTPEGQYRLGSEPPRDALEPVRRFWADLHRQAVRECFAAALAE